jgi:hypothetical protein
LEINEKISFSNENCAKAVRACHGPASKLFTRRRAAKANRVFSITVNSRLRISRTDWHRPRATPDFGSPTMLKRVWPRAYRVSGWTGNFSHQGLNC